MKIDITNMFVRIICFNKNEPVKIDGYCIDRRNNTITVFIENDTARTFKIEEVKLFN